MIFIIATSMMYPPPKKITIWLIGDSTMSIKDPKTFPETGWGMPFVNFWDSTVKVDNRAMNGRSTRTFIEEKRWDSVVNNIQEDDWVFIQFGHNDEVPTKKSYVTPDVFMTNLTKYIDDTKLRKGNPVLLTPVARRKFDSTGHILDTHEEYAKIVRAVARQNNIPLIDLSKLSMQLLQQMGERSSAYLYNHLKAGENPNYPNGKIDDTHFSELGARKMAEIVLNEIRRQEFELAQRIVARPAK
jgi:lysophospholipase L1-like esterase